MTAYSAEPLVYYDDAEENSEWLNPECDCACASYPQRGNTTGLSEDEPTNLQIRPNLVHVPLYEGFEVVFNPFWDGWRRSS